MAVFWISSVVYKYQLMFVHVTKVESGGVRRQSLLIQNGMGPSELIMDLANVECGYQSLIGVAHIHALDCDSQYVLCISLHRITS